MLPYSHATDAVKILSKHPIGFVSRRRQQGLPMTMLDNDTLRKSAYFYITFYLLLQYHKRIKCSKNYIFFTPSE